MIFLIFIWACCFVAGRADDAEEAFLKASAAASHSSGKVGSDFAETHPWFDVDGFQRAAEPDSYHRFLNGEIHLVGDSIQEVRL